MMVKASFSKIHCEKNRKSNFSHQNSNVTNTSTDKVNAAFKLQLSQCQAGQKKGQELRSLYKKLRDVIPSCKSKPLSSLEVVLHAVDYINELHKTLQDLDVDPSRSNSQSTQETNPRQNLQTGLQVHVMAVNKTHITFRDLTNVLTHTKPQTEKYQK